MIHRQVVNVTLQDIATSTPLMAGKCMVSTACARIGPSYIWRTHYRGDYNGGGNLVKIYGGKYSIYCYIPHINPGFLTLVKIYVCSDAVNERIAAFDNQAPVGPFSILLEVDDNHMNAGKCCLLEEVDTCLLNVTEAKILLEV